MPLVAGCESILFSSYILLKDWKCRVGEFEASTLSEEEVTSIDTFIVGKVMVHPNFDFLLGERKKRGLSSSAA